MKHNPKVVDFNDSASYAYHRAMQNFKSRNWLDALELLRSASEKSPENASYKLQLIREYTGAGYYPQAVRLALDLFAAGQETDELYRIFAFNLLHLGNVNTLCIFLEFAAKRVKDELCRSLFHSLLGGSCMPVPPMTMEEVREDRMHRVAARIQNYLSQKKYLRALELCDNFLPFSADPVPILLYSAEASLGLEQREDALHNADCAVRMDQSPQTCVQAANIYQLLGETEKMQAILREIRFDSMDAGQAVGVLCCLYKFGLREECADGAQQMLRKNPYNRNLLHICAVSLHACGESDQNVGKYWLRILRIDPEDCVARYYYDVCARGGLDEIHPEITYVLPKEECLRRVEKMKDVATSKDTTLSQAWREDPAFHEVILWAAQSDARELWKAAYITLGDSDDPAAMSLMRQLPVVHDMAQDESILASYDECAEHSEILQKLAGFYVPLFCQENPKAARSTYTAREARLSQAVCRYLAVRHDLYEPTFPVDIWRIYRNAAQTHDDIADCQESVMAAVAYHCLKALGRPADIDAIHKQFGGSKRRLQYYIRRMERVKNAFKGDFENEDH